VCAIYCKKGVNYVQCAMRHVIYNSAHTFIAVNMKPVGLYFTGCDHDVAILGNGCECKKVKRKVQTPTCRNHMKMKL
jgi:hypothetical protein